MFAKATSLIALSLAIPTLASPHIHRETLSEAASNAKHLIHTISTGTMASVFPSEGDNAGRPFAMMEYHAPCHPDPSLTFVLMPISLSTRNILKNDNHYATYTVQMPSEGVRSPMSRGRVAFIGVGLDAVGNLVGGKRANSRILLYYLKFLNRKQESSRNATHHSIPMRNGGHQTSRMDLISLNGQDSIFRTSTMLGVSASELFGKWRM
jgi:hypothetical protein